MHRELQLTFRIALPDGDERQIAKAIVDGFDAWDKCQATMKNEIGDAFEAEHEITDVRAPRGTARAATNGGDAPKRRGPKPGYKRKPREEQPGIPLSSLSASVTETP